MFKSIIDSFANLDLLGWISQISGLIAFTFLGIGYLFPKRKFIIFSTIAHIFFVMESGFALLFSGAIISFVSLTRNFFTAYLLYRRNKELTQTHLYIFTGAAVVLNILFIGLSNSWGDVFAYMPMVASSLVTFTQNSKKELVVKAGGIGNEALWLFYFLTSSLPLTIIRQIILVVSAVIGFIILIIKKAKTIK